MEPRLFTPEFFQVLEGLARRAAERGPGDAAAREPGRQRPGSERRPYQPGDELRQVDWKATARRRSLQVRLPEAERGGEQLLLLDRSGSLAPGSLRRDRDQRRLALALGWLALEGGAVALLAAGSGPVRRFAGRERRAALQGALERLPRPSGRAPGRPAVWPVPGITRTVYAIGDPWVGAGWWEALHACVLRGDRVKVVLLILAVEDEPPQEALLVEEVESGRELRTDLTGAGARFARRWEGYLAGLRARAREAGAEACFLRCTGGREDGGRILRAAREAGLV